MLGRAKIEIVFDSQKAALSACEAISAESGFSRAKMKVAADNNILHADIHADDAVALRACLNGLFRNLQVFEGIEENDI